MTPEDTVREARSLVGRATLTALDALVAERDALAARLAEAERNERHTRNLHDWRAKGEQEQRKRAEAAEARVAALTEALGEARPYVFGRIEPDGDWRSETARDVLGRVDAALAAADRPEGTTLRWKIGCPSGLHANDGRCNCQARPTP